MGSCSPQSGLQPPRDNQVQWWPSAARLGNGKVHMHTHYTCTGVHICRNAHTCTIHMYTYEHMGILTSPMQSTPQSALWPQEPQEVLRNASTQPPAADLQSPILWAGAAVCVTTLQAKAENWRY